MNSSNDNIPNNLGANNVKNICKEKYEQIKKDIYEITEKYSDKFDLVSGLNRMSGNLDEYISVLESFLDKEKEVVNVLNETKKSSDYSKLLPLVHSLKGVSGNIGLKSLFNSTIHTEKKLRSNDLIEMNKYIDTLVQELTYASQTIEHTINKK